MNGSPRQTPAIAANFLFRTPAKWLLGILTIALCTAAMPYLPSQSTDEQYIQIMNLLDRADALRKTGKTDAAKAKYKQVESALILFKRNNPLFAPKIVSYRLAEVTDRLESRPPLPAASASPSAKPQVNLEAAPKASAPAKMSVKLIDPGAEPRKVLRLHVKAGDKQTVIMTIKMSMEAPGMATGSNSMNIPTMSLPSDVTIQNVAPNGDISYEMAFGEPGVVDEPGTLPQVAQAMKTSLAGLKGLTVTATMTDRGMTKKVDVKAPPTADPQMRQITSQIKEGMYNMSSPLPDEAIGAGAKWEVNTPVKSQGMTLDQIADYQLVSMDGDHISTTATLTQSAANQKIQNPALGGVQMKLISFTNNATGTVASDLSKLMPLQFSLDMHMDMDSEIMLGKKTQPMAMKMAMNMTMESK